MYTIKQDRQLNLVSRTILEKVVACLCYFLGAERFGRFDPLFRASLLHFLNSCTNMPLHSCDFIYDNCSYCIAVKSLWLFRSYAIVTNPCKWPSTVLEYLWYQYQEVIMIPITNSHIAHPFSGECYRYSSHKWRTRLCLVGPEVTGILPVSVPWNGQAARCYQIHSRMWTRLGWQLVDWGMLYS